MCIYEQNDHLLYKLNNEELVLVNSPYLNDFTGGHVDDDDEELSNLKRFNIEYYRFTVTGFDLSLSMLKLLLGHPKFYQHIYKKFDFY